ncbi:hypothetical protein TL16_g12692 [Triparma laevis f. inornata]|uniref:Uncharacterized protein n=1 Tax=Triparma laevis f. inornata TaxID=1714386 RepID=A0A9W7EVV0_9STRA|nr:hypothetical protein TL16_g12692 [Triparma laevis f. inornata]
MTTILPDLNASKSPSDPNLYRHIQLPNGLKVLLIQDTLATRSNKADFIFGNESEDEESDEEGEEGEKEEEGEEGGEDDEEEDGDNDDEEDEEDETGERKASCSLTVGCGSLYDPPTHPGLAHLLEHMLFMGTEPFPSENHYDKSLSKWGGYDNAYTGMRKEMEHTVYYFDVDQAHFFRSLNIFRHFFSTPLLSPSSLSREIKAVQSEFDICLSSDSSRLQQLLCHVSKPDHPFNTFSWGNEESLNKKPEELEGKLREMFEMYYYAENMRMTIIGGFSLDTLQRRVEKMFDIVPPLPRLLHQTFKIDNTTIPATSTISELGYPFDPSTFQSLNYVIPLKSRHTLNLTYQLPPQTDKFKCKPTDYVCHLLGHESEGSILGWLKKFNLAQSIYAGVGGSGAEDSSGWCLFCVSVELTVAGVEEWQRIVEVIEEYIDILKNNTLPEYIWNEMIVMSDLRYKYQEAVSPLDTVEALGEEFGPTLAYPVERILDGQRLFEYREEEIRICDMKEKKKEFYPATIISCTPSGLKVTYNDSFIDSIFLTLDSTPKEYNPGQSLMANKKRYKVKIDNVGVEVDPSEEFEEEGVKQQFPSIPPPANPSDLPKIGHKSSNIILHYSQTKLFSLPLVEYRLKLTPTSTFSTPNLTTLDLLSLIVGDRISEIGYDASLANVNYEVCNEMDGWVYLKVYGYDDKCLEMVEELVKVVVDGKAGEGYDRQKEELERRYGNKNFSGSSYATDLRLLNILKHKVQEKDKLEYLKTLNVETYEKNVKEILSSVRIEGLIVGNCVKSDATACGKLLSKLLQNPQPSPLKILRVYKLPPSKLITRPKLNPADLNTTVESYVQFGPDSVHKRVMVDLIVQLAEEAFFDQLRTKEQFGYSVSMDSKWSCGVVGLTFKVTSATKGGEEIRERIKEFQRWFEDEFLEEKGEGEKNFEDNVCSLAKNKLEVYSNLSELAGFLWGEITSGRYEWEAVRKEVTCLREVFRGGVKGAFSQILERTGFVAVKEERCGLCVKASEEKMELGEKVKRAEAELREAKAELSEAKMEVIALRDERDDDGGGGGEKEGIKDEVVVVPTASAPTEPRDRSSGKTRKAATEVEEQPRNVKKVKTALPKGKKKGNGFIWTADEDAALVEAVDEYGLEFGRIKAEAGARLGDHKVTHSTNISVKFTLLRLRN